MVGGIQDGVMVLHMVSYFGHFDIVQYLIEKGADVNFKSNVSISTINNIRAYLLAVTKLL